MAKSKGNFYRLQDIQGKGFDPMHLRLLYLSSHYRKNLDFSWQAMEQAKTNYERISEFIQKLGEYSSGKKTTIAEGEFCQKHISMFEEAMDDDLNTPLALSVLYDMITYANKKISSGEMIVEKAAKILTTFEKMNKVFGLKFLEKEIKVPENVKRMANERLEARNNKDFAKADELRKEIEKMGYLIKDLDDTYELTLAS
jgi:cysteinyl-tRNA synthetase